MEEKPKRTVSAKIAVALFMIFIVVQLGFWYYIYKNVEFLQGTDACAICSLRTGNICKPERFTVNLTNFNGEINGKQSLLNQ